MPKHNQKKNAKLHEELDEQAALLDNKAQQQLRTLRHKHPDCIPVYFSKHKDAPKSLKEPTTNFMLFKKDLKIEQAMYRLYKQIDTKGLYFFCLQVNKDKAKYVKIQPGPTIEDIFNRYGRNQCLVLIYANSELGLQGIQKMQKCLITVLVVAAVIWALLFGYNYYISSLIGDKGKGNVQGWVQQAN